MEIPPLLQRLVSPLQRSPGLRGTVYLGTAAALMQTIGGWYEQDYPTAVVLVHLTILPVGAAVTAAGLALEGRSPAELLPMWRDGALLALGFGACAASSLAFLAVLRSLGLVSAPKWGWEDAPLSTVLKTVGFQLVGHLAVAWNEEQVFRGYGFETLREALGTPGAMLVLIPLFAAAHPLKPRVLFFQGLLGLNVTIQRLVTGSMWFGVGYHWAWNAMQMAVFGPPAIHPIRPLYLHGPEVLMGRTSSAEPGVIAGIANVVNIALMGAAWWLRKRRARQRQEKK
jgi:membrane protease YdiL (CAAX protease family)